MFHHTKLIAAAILLLSLKSLSAPTNVDVYEPGCKVARIDSQLTIAVQLIEDVRRKLPNDFKELQEKAVSRVQPLDCSDCDVLSAVTHSMKVNDSEETSDASKPVDCSDIYESGKDKDGIYEIWPEGMMSKDALIVYCDMTTDGGGWTVIQRRGDFSNSYDFFDQEWSAYKAGFGDISEDFWIGNRHIFALTNQRMYQLRIHLRDWDGNFTFAVYSPFWIDGERHNYLLHLGGYSGNAGDSLRLHNGKYFTSKDTDNDEEPAFNCAVRWRGAWWYKKCYGANLNGLYRNGTHEPQAGGVHWHGFKGFQYSLKETAMMIRPTDFKTKTSHKDFSNV